MCMMFSCNPHIIFVTFLQFERSQFLAQRQFLAQFLPKHKRHWASCERNSSALDKLLGQLGTYTTWLSSIAYLQKQLCIFIFFTPRFFLL